MKPLQLLVASAIVAALVLSPLAVGAGSITFSSPASGASYKGTQSYSITGAVSPIPSQPDNVFVSVKSPGGLTVDAGSVSVSQSTGTFTYATATGGSSSWVSGTYTITATDSFGAIGSTTFSYTSSAPSTSYNVTKALVDIEGNLTQLKSEVAIMQADNKGNYTALNTALTALSTQVSSISQQVGTLTTNLGTVQTDVTNMQGQLTTMANNITTLNTAVQAAQSAALAAQTSATNASNAVSSTQTYVLVVAVLAAITLVLELADRKSVV